MKDIFAEVDNSERVSRAKECAERLKAQYGKLTEVLLITGNEKKLHMPLQPTPMQQILFYCSGERDEYCSEYGAQG